MMARFKWYLDHLSSHQLEKNVVKVGPPLTKFSGSTHAMDVDEGSDQIQDLCSSAGTFLEVLACI